MTLLDRAPTIRREGSDRATRQPPAAPLGGSYITRAATTASSSEGTYVSRGSPFNAPIRAISERSAGQAHSASPDAVPTTGRAGCVVG